MGLILKIIRLTAAILCAVVFGLIFNQPTLAQDSTSHPKITSQNAVDLKLTRWLTRGAAIKVVWSPNSKLIAVGSSVGVTLLDPRKPQIPTRILNEYTGLVGGLAFSADGKQIA